MQSLVSAAACSWWCTWSSTLTSAMELAYLQLIIKMFEISDLLFITQHWFLLWVRCLFYAWRIFRSGQCQKMSKKATISKEKLWPSESWRTDARLSLTAPKPLSKLTRKSMKQNTGKWGAAQDFCTLFKLLGVNWQMMHHPNTLAWKNRSAFAVDHVCKRFLVNSVCLVFS